MAISLSMSVLSKSLSYPLVANIPNVSQNVALPVENMSNKYSATTPTTGICGLLHFSYLWEIMLFWEIFLPIMGLICFFRSTKSEPLSWVWLYSVVHANLSVWIWLAYFVFTYNYCWQEIASLKCPDCSTVACTGGIFLGISLVISIIAAIANDQYYPDARMTPREAKNFFAHLKRSHPEMTVILRTHLNSMGDWTRVKKVFYPQTWYDDTIYPDVAQVLGNRQAVIFKLTMAVFAKSIEAKDDLRAFVWEFGQEHNQTITLEDTDEYMLNAALHPAQGQNNVNNRRGISLAQRYGRYQGTGIPRKQPTLTTERTMRIYVRKDGNLPLLLDCLLRFAWILNLIGLSGIVLHCLTKLHSITERVHVEKRYGPRSQESPIIEQNIPANSATTGDSGPPSYTFPYSSPPPRYVSVVGLNEDPPQDGATCVVDMSKGSRRLKGKKNKTKKAENKKKESSSPVLAPEEDDSGLPSYDEAVKNQTTTTTTEVVIERPPSRNTTASNVMRISMV